MKRGLDYTDYNDEPQNPGLQEITVKRNVAIVGSTIALVAFSGFIVHVLVAKYFGASTALDAFLIAFLLLYFVQNQFQVSGIVNSSFIPIYNLSLLESKKEARSFFCTVALIIWLSFSVVSLLCLFLAPSIIQLIGPGLPVESKVLSIQIFRLFSLLLPVVGLTGVLASALRAEGRFFTPTAGPFLINSCLILMVFWFSTKYGIMSYAFGWVLGCAGQFLIVIKPLLNAPGFSLRCVSWKSKYLRGFLKRFALLLLDLPIGLIILTLERSFGSAITTGTVSHLNYAKVVYSLPLRFMVGPIQTVMFSKFAQQAAIRDRGVLRNQVEKTLRFTVFLILPAVVLIVFFREDIVRLLFERGRFSPVDTYHTSSLLLYFAISMLGIAMWWLFRQVSHAIGDIVSPLLTGLVCLALYFFGNRLLIGKMGASSLALNWAISYSLASLLLGGVIAHKLGEGLFRGMIPVTIKMVVGTCILFIFLLSSTSLGHGSMFPFESKWSTLLHILLYGLTSLGIYFVTAWLMGLEEVKEIAMIIKRGFQKLYLFVG